MSGSAKAGIQLDRGAAIVTGAAGGIGSVIAARLAAGGMSVVLGDIDGARLDAVVTSLQRDVPGAVAVAVQGDVGEASHHDELVAAAEDLGEGGGGLRLSVLNAGISLPGLSWEMPIERWELTTRVNYWGVVHGLRAGLRTMVPRGDGWVVAISSGAGLVATPGLAPYVATKHALVGAMESTHHELVRVGSPVGVTVVCPGNIATTGPDRPSMSGVDASADSAFPGVVAGMQGTIASGVSSGAEPITVAEALMDGVASGRFWVLPQPELAWAMGDRARRVSEGDDPVDLLG